MTILKEQLTSQTFYILPRSYDGTSVRFVKEGSGEVLSYSITPMKSGYLQEITITPTLKEGNFYNLTVFNDDGNITFKDRVFCTNQNIATFSVNKDEYTTHTTDNDFIIYEQ